MSLISRFLLALLLVILIALGIIGASNSATDAASRVWRPLATLGPTAIDSEQRLLVNAFGPPPPNADWDRMVSTLPAGSIVNLGLFNGIEYSTGPDPAWLALIDRFHARGVLVVGYIDTNFATGRPSPYGWDRTLGGIKGFIDRWYEQYPIDGIFFDQAWQYRSAEPFYQALRDHVRAKQGVRGNLTVVNMATYALYPETIDLADVVITVEGWNYEQYAKGYKQADFVAVSWPPSKVAHQIYGVAPHELDDAIALSRQRGAGWVFFTDLGYNYYATLPSPDFWAREVAAVTGRR